MSNLWLYSPAPEEAAACPARTQIKHGARRLKQQGPVPPGAQQHHGTGPPRPCCVPEAAALPRTPSEAGSISATASPAPAATRGPRGWRRRVPPPRGPTAATCQKEEEEEKRRQQQQRLRARAARSRKRREPSNGAAGRGPRRSAQRRAVGAARGVLTRGGCTCTRGHTRTDIARDNATHARART